MMSLAARPAGHPTFGRILVAIDFEPESTVALDFAIELAEHEHSSLTLVHVWDVPHVPYTSLASPSVLERAVEASVRDLLNEVVSRTRARYADVTGILVQGTPRRGIIAEIERTHADLLVMGTHGRRGILRMIEGSLGAKLARVATVPVLIVPGGRGEDESAKRSSVSARP
jgi:nucleotide-binding universal stress UspA family protein